MFSILSYVSSVCNPWRERGNRQINPDFYYKPIVNASQKLALISERHIVLQVVVTLSFVALLNDYLLKGVGQHYVWAWLMDDFLARLIFSVNESLIVLWPRCCQAREYYSDVQSLNVFHVRCCGPNALGVFMGVELWEWIFPSSCASSCNLQSMVLQIPSGIGWGHSFCGWYHSYSRNQQTNNSTGVCKPRSVAVSHLFQCLHWVSVSLHSSHLVVS